MRRWLVAIALLAACSDNHDYPLDAAVTPDAPKGDAGIDAPPQGCTDNSACNDNNACTTDTCNANHQCEHAPKAIDDSIACTTDACDPTTGNVTHTPVDSVCEVDGKTCTVATCSATTGCSETPTANVCDDGASCSTDACNPTANGADATTGCTHTLNDTACTDTYACTTNTCSPSAVAADPTTGCLVTPVDTACGDNITCTADTCNPSGNGADAAGCVHQTNNAMCELDGKSCTVAACSATTGCSETPNDAMCNDNATCTTDTCSSTGPGATGCSNTPNDAACADNAECSSDACAPGTAGANPTTGCAYTADPGVCSSNAMCTNAFDCVCDAGYTGDGLSCSGVSCDPLTAPTNGAVVKSNGGLYPSTATYTCDAGFVSTRAMTRSCKTDGTWTGRAPTCVAPTFFVVRIGDGNGLGASGTAAPVFLDEHDAAGALLRTIALPTAASGNNAPFTLANNAPNEGGLSLSADGAYVTLGGYAAVPGTTGVKATSNRSSDTTPVNRVVARVSSDGTVDTSTHLIDAFSGDSVRGVCTADGTAFWLSGTGTAVTAGVQYAALGSTAAPMQIVATPSNVRHIHIFGSQLYISSSSGTSTGVLSVGSGTPTTTGQTATLLATVTNSDSFAVLDVDPNVPGMDTIYIAVDTGGTAGVVNMQKWTFDGSVWTQATFAPTVTGTTVPRTIGLAAWRDGGATHLVVSTVESPARILSIVDDGSTTAPAASVLATAASNTVFRGVARSPTP